jgi:hypothetical protein
VEKGCSVTMKSPSSEDSPSELRAATAPAKAPPAKRGTDRVRERRLGVRPKLAHAIRIDFVVALYHLAAPQPRMESAREQWRLPLDRSRYGVAHPGRG